MKYLIKWKVKELGMMYEKHIEASGKKEALKKMGKNLPFVQAIYLKLN